MELLSIFNEEVELLVKEGRPDLSYFFDSLESHSITLLEEVLSLQAEYGCKRVSWYLVWILNTYTNKTIRTSSIKLLRYCCQLSC